MAGETDKAAAAWRGLDNGEQGRWGERMAEAYLCAHGYHLVERNARPFKRDRRYEIDLVVQDDRTRGIVFVEVKTHAAHSPFARRLWAVGRVKRRKLYRACASWLMANHWHGCFRFDVVEVFGRHTSGTPPEIDHVQNVRLFPPKWRFWRAPAGTPVPMLKFRKGDEDAKRKIRTDGARPGPARKALAGGLGAVGAFLRAWL